MGHVFATTPAGSHRPPPWVGLIALAYAAVCFIWRHTTGQVPEPHGGDLNLLFDKWTLGPMRLLDVLSIAVVVLAFAPRKARWLVPSWLEWLGRAALPAFCAHLMVCLIALALFGGGDGERSAWVDVGLLTAAFAAMFAAAGLTAWVRSRPSDAKAKRAHALGGAD
jgi:peptidoglycan/LPS O-acetylase OafA/YrhL